MRPWAVCIVFDGNDGGGSVLRERRGWRLRGVEVDWVLGRFWEPAG